MFDFDDKITLGVFAGLIGNTVKIIFEFFIYRFDRTIEPLSHLATTSVFPEGTHDKISHLIIGIYADYTIASILGILIVYLLLYTGTKHFILKGIVVSSFAWLIIYIPVRNFGIVEIISTTFRGNLVHLISHILIGIILSLVIIIFGKNIIKK